MRLASGLTIRRYRQYVGQGNAFEILVRKIQIFGIHQK